MAQGLGSRGGSVARSVQQRSGGPRRRSATEAPGSPAPRCKGCPPGGAEPPVRRPLSSEASCHCRRVPREPPCPGKRAAVLRCRGACPCVPLVEAPPAEPCPLSAIRREAAPIPAAERWRAHPRAAAGIPDLSSQPSSWPQLCRCRVAAASRQRRQVSEPAPVVPWPGRACRLPERGERRAGCPGGARLSEAPRRQAGGDRLKPWSRPDRGQGPAPTTRPLP